MSPLNDNDVYFTLAKLLLATVEQVGLNVDQLQNSVLNITSMLYKTLFTECYSRDIY